MGIDKLNVKFVIHTALPKSIEGYYQETGRAGRNGEISDCILFYHREDARRMIILIEKDAKDTSVSTFHKKSFRYMMDYCQDKVKCRREILLQYLGDEYNRQDCLANEETTCDNCRNLVSF